MRKSRLARSNQRRFSGLDERIPLRRGFYRELANAVGRSGDRGASLKVEPRVVFSQSRLGARVAAMGRAISGDFARQDLDVVILVENAFVFGADLVRAIKIPVVCHFVRSELRDIEMAGYARREVFFSRAPVLKGRNVLLVDTLLRTGITLDFLGEADTGNLATVAANRGAGGRALRPPGRLKAGLLRICGSI